MFDIGSPELLLVAIVAIVVIGPKDLPKAMRLFGYWVGRGRSVMRQFRSGFDAMVREAELQEMEKRWAEENKRIMAEHPTSDSGKALPAPEPDTAAAGGADAAAPGAADAPVMVEKPAVIDAHPAHEEPELPLAPDPDAGR